MKRTIMDRVSAPYTLHDRTVAAFDIVQKEPLDTLILRIQPGIKKCVMEYVEEKGYVEFQKVDWDFCCAYQTKYSGWLSEGDSPWKECVIEIVYLGDMVFVTEE